MSISETRAMVAKGAAGNRCVVRASMASTWRASGAIGSRSFHRIERNRKKGKYGSKSQSKEPRAGPYGFKLELQLRPKPGIQSEQAIVPTPAAIPAVFQQELKELDEEMKL